MGPHVFATAPPPRPTAAASSSAAPPQRGGSTGAPDSLAESLQLWWRYGERSRSPPRCSTAEARAQALSGEALHLPEGSAGTGEPEIPERDEEGYITLPWQQTRHRDGRGRRDQKEEKLDNNASTQQDSPKHVQDLGKGIADLMLRKEKLDRALADAEDTQRTQKIMSLLRRQRLEICDQIDLKLCQLKKA